MISLIDIKNRADQLSEKTEAGSITPEEVGALIADLALYTQSSERDGSTLGIRKVYPTLEAMQADTEPIGDSGKPLRRGNLVAIYSEERAQSDPNSGLVSMWTGSGWTSIARIGTAMRHDYTAIEQRLGRVEGAFASKEALRTALEGIKNDVQNALDTAVRTINEKGTEIDESLKAFKREQTQAINTFKREQEQAIETLKSSLPAYSLSVSRKDDSGDTTVTLHGGQTDSSVTFSMPRQEPYKITSRLNEVTGATEVSISDGTHTSTVDLQLPDVTATDALEDSAQPISARAVKQAVEELRKLTLDADTEQTEDGTKVTLSRNGVQVTEFVVAGGGAGGGGSAHSTKTQLITQLTSNRVKLGDRVVLTYTYNHLVEGEPDGTPARLNILLKRGVTTIADIALGSTPNGTTATLDLSKYLTTADGYSILLTAEYEEDGQLKTRKAQAFLSVIDLKLSLYNKAEVEAFIAGGGVAENLSAIFSVRGSAKELSLYIDGELHESKPLTSAGGRQTFSLPLRTLSSGSHSIQAVATADGIKSNSLYFDLLKGGSEAPFVGVLFSRSDGRIFSKSETPTLLGEQYTGISWEYISRSTNAGVTAMSANGKRVSVLKVYQGHTERMMRASASSYVYSLEGRDKTIGIEIVANTASGLGIREGAALELLSEGRSNSEESRSEWTSGTTTTTFEGVDFSSSGWIASNLHLMGGAKATIHYKPFDRDAKATGVTIICELRTTSVRHNDKAVFSCFDAEGHKQGVFAGFAVMPHSVTMPFGGNVQFRSEEGETITRDLGLKMPLASGAFYQLAIVITPESDRRVVSLYINGVLSKADVYTDTAFSQRTPQDIVFDSAGADLDVRSLRIYNTALSDDEVLNNYITDRPELDEMLELQKRNDVLSPDTGDISLQKLVQQGKGVLSVIMDGGLESVWGVSTDTKTRHNVAEIVFRSPYGRAYDLKATDITVRRQGTSTSTYPVKNLRFELQKRTESKVYRNVGKGDKDVWELVEDRTYTMREGVKPMKLINIKVDYADSSLQNNTGGAKLWNKLCTEIAELKTPAMQVDKSARSALDGIACSVFTAGNSEEAQRFCGTAQFNNDKSKSGYIFGQSKKDGNEIALEGINNTNAVANFKFTEDVATQLAKADTNGFDASFEFLYPEKDYEWNGKTTETTAPDNIKQSVIRLMQFVKDCTPQGVDPSRMSTDEVKARFKSDKFKREVSQYFSVANLCAWYVWTDYLMAVDQRAKNTFLRTWDGRVWWYTYYDGDTSMGKRNDAMLAYDYSLSRDTFDAERSKYAFEGHNSILWCLVLANLEVEMKAIAQKMRSVLTNKTATEYLNSPLRDWAERTHNKSNIVKYLKPTYTDYNGKGTMNYVFALDGTMEAVKADIIDRRFSLRDAYYNPDDAIRKDNIPCYVGKSQGLTTMQVTAGDEYFFGWATQNGGTRQYEQVLSGKTMTLRFEDAISQNDPIRLAGASRMRKLDLGTTAPFMQGSLNLAGCKILEELIAPTTSANPTPWYMMLRACTTLKRIDLTGQRAVSGTESSGATSFDVSNQTSLTELLLSGTAVQSVRLAEGAPLVKLTLPSSLRQLRLRSLPLLEMSGLIVADWSSVTSLDFAHCAKLDYGLLLEKMTSLERVRIEGIDIKGDDTLLKRLMSVKGLDARGSAVEYCALVGRYQLTKYIDDAVFAEYQNHFPELALRQPQYTILEMDDSITESANISNLDNQTGARFGKAYEVSAHIKKILDSRFGCMGKQAEKGKMKVFPLQHNDWRRYADKKDVFNSTEARTNGEEGDMFIFEPRYWYKGVNDIKNKKKYACFASVVKPDDYDQSTTKVVRHSDIAKMPDKAIVPIGTMSASILDNRTYNSYRLNELSSYKRVRFNSVLGVNGIGAGFYDEAGKLLSAVLVEPTNDYFNDGMYYIADIPAGAKTLLFTVRKAIDDANHYVVLTNSNKVEDCEPFWVEHKPCLIGVMKGILRNSKFGSFVDQANDNAEVDGLSLAQLRSSLLGRGMHPITYEEHKDIANLAMFKYGTRCPETIVGNNYRTEIGNYVQIIIPYLQSGMNDSEIWGDEGVRYRVDSGGGLVTERSTYADYKNSQILMGYRRLSGGYSQYLDGGVTTSLGDNEGNYWKITNEEGEIRYMQVTRGWGQQVRGTHFGRFMDLADVTKATNTQNSKTQFYGAFQSRMFTNMSNGNNRELLIGEEGNNKYRQTWNMGRVLLPLMDWSNSSAENRTTRIAYSGDIEVMQDLQQFLAVPFNF
nr:MAG TPA: Concanavalin A-like lectin/glucanase superfamily protein [Caudoviricetes sp.]